MGSGKSTVGEILSKSISYDYIDLDILIEETSGLLISDIFKKFGEEHFRSLESDALENVSEKSEKTVVSTGGGIVLKPSNREIMTRSGVTIYLKTELETVWERVKDDTSRPLLSGENPYEKAKELLSGRKDLYEKSDLIVETDRLDPDQVSEKIAGLLFE